MSSDVIESAGMVQHVSVRRDSANRSPAGVAAILSLFIAALLALLVHRLIPADRMVALSWMDALPAAQHPYPVLLTGIMGLSVLSALVQGVWKPIRPVVRYYAPLLAGGTAIVCGWDWITTKTAWLPQPFFPGPDEVLGALIEDRAVLFSSVRNSLLLLVIGYSVGVCAGFVCGVVIGWFPLGRYWGMPVLKILGPIPATSLVVVVMTLSTNAFLCGVTLIAYAVWFPVTMLTSSGIANVRVAYLDVAKTLGAGRGYLIFHVAIPSALPNVFLGLFVGLLTSFLTLPVAETVGVQAGLGWYIPWQKGYAEYGKVYAALLLMSVLFSTLLTLLFKLRNRILKWQKGTIKW